MKNSAIKKACNLSKPDLNLGPTNKYAVFEANFRSAGNWKEDNSISINDMKSFAGMSLTKLPVMTEVQCRQKARGIWSFVQRLRDKMALKGLYIGKMGPVYKVYKRSDNLEVIKMRNRKSAKACFRNKILISNTPITDVPSKSLFLNDNSQMMLDIGKWV